jgi:hypothetical protein
MVPDQLLDECSAAIRSAGAELERVLGPDKVGFKAWNKNYVAAAFELAVDIPTRGPVDDVDIRAVEPVVILFHRTNYPDVAPSAYSDRKDFPADKLPHLNPVKRGSPAHFCLHRGSVNDWFAEHSIIDFKDRIRGWLRDAASGRLIREEDRFEPTRLENVNGLCIFDPEVLTREIQDRLRTTDCAGWLRK